MMVLGLIPMILVPLFGLFVVFMVFRTFTRHRSFMNQIQDHVMDQVANDQRPPARAETPSASPTADRNYSCDKCGAAIDSDTEISPSGDFKCQYCDSWSNVNS